MVESDENIAPQAQLLSSFSLATGFLVEPAAFGRGIGTGPNVLGSESGSCREAAANKRGFAGSLRAEKLEEERRQDLTLRFAGDDEEIAGANVDGLGGSSGEGKPMRLRLLLLRKRWLQRRSGEVSVVSAAAAAAAAFAARKNKATVELEVCALSSRRQKAELHSNTTATAATTTTTTAASIELATATVTAKATATTASRGRLPKSLCQ